MRGFEPSEIGTRSIAELWRSGGFPRDPVPSDHVGTEPDETYSTVTDFARLRGLSTSVPRAQAV